MWPWLREGKAIPIRSLEQIGAQIADLSASVCVVGAGVAGLIAATRLASNKGLRVVVVESGLRQFDAALDALNEIDNPASNYPARLPRRFRGLGGTSLLWAGKLLPLTRSDALPRPYLDLEGWPFDVAELDRYTRDIEIMGVDHESYEEDASSHLDPDSLLSRNDQDFVLRWPKRPALENHNLAHVLRHEIEKLDNLEIWLGATVARFEADSAFSKIASLRATNHAGQTLNVAATQYLIAAGALVHSSPPVGGSAAEPPYLPRRRRAGPLLQRPSRAQGGDAPPDRLGRDQPCPERPLALVRGAAFAF